MTNLLYFMVGATGFEPATPSPPERFSFHFVYNISIAYKNIIKLICPKKGLFLATVFLMTSQIRHTI